jgi:energy-coupling factor transport system substrate-specific component
MTTTSRSAVTAARMPRWRTVDIVVTSVVAAMFGALYWAWQYVPITQMFGFFPPFAALLNTVWLVAGPVGALIVRKPGAAIYTELVAALFEALIGTHWGGTSVLVYGLVEGAGAELAFLLFAYRVWRLPVAILSGALAGAAMAVLDVWIYRYYTGWSVGYQLSYLAAAVVSGAVVAGAGSWYLVRAMAATGVLAPFASGRRQRLI